MNLTDDQIRSLRADCEAAVIPYASTAQREAAVVRLPTSTVLSLVEEVERLRSMEPLRESVIALAAKAEAGKGLYELLVRTQQIRGHGCTTLNCVECQALARWEAVENG